MGARGLAGDGEGKVGPGGKNGAVADGGGVGSAGPGVVVIGGDFAMVSQHVLARALVR